jgi:hypothetical protein
MTMLIKGFQKIWESNLFIYLFFWNKWEYPLQEKQILFHSCVFDAIKIYNTKFEKCASKGSPPPFHDTNVFAKNSKRSKKKAKFRLKKKTFLQDFP